MRRAALLVLGLLVMGGCAAPADTSSPEATVSALAAAVDTADPAAVDRLICTADRADGRTLLQVRDGLTELDRGFADAGWHAEPGPVTARTDTGATASLVVTTVGWPTTESPEVREYLAAGLPPRPLDLLGPGGELHLVVEDGHWLACGSDGVS